MSARQESGKGIFGAVRLAQALAGQYAREEGN